MNQNKCKILKVLNVTLPGLAPLLLWMSLDITTWTETIGMIILHICLSGILALIMNRIHSMFCINGNLLYIILKDK